MAERTSAIWTETRGHRSVRLGPDPRGSPEPILSAGAPAVLDATVVVDAVAPNVSLSSSAIRTIRRLARQGTDLLAPRLLLAECANALLTGIKRSKWTGAAADLAYAELGRLPVKFADDVAHLDRAWELSRRYDNHPVYDMLYVAVAERAGATFITTDESLRQRLSHLAWIVAPDV